MNIELSRKEATFLRHAISVALDFDRYMWDTEQAHVLSMVSQRIWRAQGAEREVRLSPPA